MKSEAVSSMMKKTAERKRLKNTLKNFSHS